MADPIVSRFVTEHESLRARNRALLERVAVLEKALEDIASSETGTTVYMQDLATEALDG